jgi:multidrug efflux pump subunit AcrA (membrane-fusion protein)
MSIALPIGQATPELVPLLMEMLKFGVTAFKAGKQLEGIIDDTADKFREQAKAQEGQPKPPSPEVQKLQMQAQLEQQKMQFQSQLEQQKLQANIELERAKQEYQSQETQLRMTLEEQRNAQEKEQEMKIAQMKMMTERNTQVLLAHINNGAKIEVARIGADQDDGAMAYANEEDMARAMEHPMQPIANAINQGNAQILGAMGQLVDKIEQAQSRPKTVVRGPDGKIVGVQ